MKRFGIRSFTTACMCFSPSDALGEVPAAPEAAEAIPPAPPTGPVIQQRIRQNGFTRPAENTATGMVWDIADEISEKMGRPAFRDEVWKEYQRRYPAANQATNSTQYSRWCGFHKVQDTLRAIRAEEKAKAKAESEAAKIAAEGAKQKAAEEKAAEKAAKEQARAEKAAAAAKAKEEKAAAAAKAKEEKAAAAKAAKEEAARKAAEAAAAEIPPAPPAQ